MGLLVFHLLSEHKKKSGSGGMEAEQEGQPFLPKIMRNRSGRCLAKHQNVMHYYSFRLRI